MAVWFSGNVVGLINEVTLRRAGLVLRWVTVRGNTLSVFNQATQANSTQPGHPSVGIGVISTGDGYGHGWKRDSEFCIAVGPVTRTAGSLTQSVKGADC